MHKEKGQPSFFIGYMNSVPKDLAIFLTLVIIGFLGSVSATAFFASASIEDAGDGRPRWDLGPQDFTGILEYRPYPVLRLASDGDKPARTLMLSGLTKVGVIEKARPFDNKLVQARGIMLERGDLKMLQIFPNQRGFQSPKDGKAESFAPQEVVKLGKWRLTGEICDGKCYAGAMRPGRGLAHKACATLCLHDGTPPVFVSEGEVEGRNFFLLADENGKLLGKEISKFVALYVSAEGQIEKLDDLMIFKVDVSSIKVQ